MKLNEGMTEIVFIICVTIGILIAGNMENKAVEERHKYSLDSTRISNNDTSTIYKGVLHGKTIQK